MRNTTNGALIGSLSATVLLMAVAGCSTEQGYYAGQGWQQNECNKIIDMAERNRCMSRANAVHDDYKRQTQPK